MKGQYSQANQIINNLKMVEVVFNAETVFEVVVVFAILCWIEFIKRSASKWIVCGDNVHKYNCEGGKKCINCKNTLTVMRLTSQYWRDVLHDYHKLWSKGGMMRLVLQSINWISLLYFNHLIVIVSYLGRLIKHVLFYFFI